VTHHDDSDTVIGGYPPNLIDGNRLPDGTPWPGAPIDTPAVERAIVTQGLPTTYGPPKPTSADHERAARRAVEALADAMIEDDRPAPVQTNEGDAVRGALDLLGAVLDDEHEYISEDECTDDCPACALVRIREHLRTVTPPLLTLHEDGSITSSAPTVTAEQVAWAARDQGWLSRVTMGETRAFLAALGIEVQP
jgi:hypothetical protein